MIFCLAFLKFSSLNAHLLNDISIIGASQVALVIKNLPANAGDIRDSGWIPGSGRSPWRRKWQPTSVFLPGKSHGLRSLAGYSPLGSQRVGRDRSNLACTHLYYNINCFSISSTKTSCFSCVSCLQLINFPPAFSFC